VAFGATAVSLRNERNQKMWELKLGASIVENGVARFRVWAPLAKKVAVRLLSTNARREISLRAGERGYFEGEETNVYAGEHYLYLLNNEAARPDPASRFQPLGVHGPSQIVDPRAFSWDDDGWRGVPLREYIIYELHVGTFTREGTFDAAIDYLDYLKDLGISVIELMPVCQFPGIRNWGYDGVYPFAPQNSYGGPEGLKRLINACHKKDLGVMLDVVYNHLGPDGNYLGSFAPYFTDRYKTPWGEAVNFDGSHSDEVRNYFISNALYWITEYHIDGLRLDAIHDIFDFGALHFLKELADAVHAAQEALARQIHIIAESDLNDVKVINPPEIGGYGLDAQWNDDFHHSLHTLVTGETNAYYQDFGKLDQLAKALSEGFVYSGQYSTYRKRRHGNNSRARPADQMVVSSQNHDQVANRINRLSRTQPFEQLKLIAAIVLLAPYVPLLFMGEEYGEKAPFHYFVSHSDPALVDAIRRGRQAEFARFGWLVKAPDPQDEETFLDSKLDILGPRSAEQQYLNSFYRNLIRVRKEYPAITNPAKEQMEVKTFENEQALCVRRWYGKESTFSLCSFSECLARETVVLPEGKWVKVLDSSSHEWGGKGEVSPSTLQSTGTGTKLDLNPYTFVLYRSIQS
jgi:maltooligosyltrehalose trehalohydrolase